MLTKNARLLVNNILFQKVDACFTKRLPYVVLSDNFIIKIEEDFKRLKNNVKFRDRNALPKFYEV